MAATAEGEPVAIERTMLPHPDAALLFAAGKPPPIDATKLAKFPLKRLKLGDTVTIPRQKPLVLDETYVNDERAQILAEDAPIPFIVVKVQSEWLVNADPVIAGRRAAARVAGGAASKPGPWTNTPEVLQSLEAAVAVGEYSLRPPQGFKKTLSEPAAWAWSGKAHDENRTPLLLVTQAQFAESELPKSLEDGLKDVLSGISPKHLEWQEGKMERGEIGGLKFVRVDWAGVRQPDAPEAVRGQKAHGFVYFALDGNRAITIVFFDAEPQYRANLASCQSAALTWRKAKLD